VAQHGAGRSIGARAWRVLGARGDVLFEHPLITLEGNERLGLENHQGVAEYTPSRLVVLTRLGPVRVCGKGLKLVALSKQYVIVQGTLHSVSFGPGEAQ
jgi:sporulation protein YqfC